MLRKIPGFRSGTWWKSAIAVAGYLAILLLLVVGNPSVKLLGLLVFAGVLIGTNAGGIRPRLPIFNSSNRAVAGIGWAALALVGFAILIVGAPPRQPRATDTAIAEAAPTATPRPGDTARPTSPPRPTETPRTAATQSTAATAVARTSPLQQMALAFEGNPSESAIKAKLDRAMDLYHTEKTDENYGRAGSTLVGLRQQNGTKEMDILDEMIRMGAANTSATFPQAAGLASAALRVTR